MRVSGRAGDRDDQQPHQNQASHIGSIVYRIEAQPATVTGSFDRTLRVSGPTDLTITNPSGDVRVTPGADGTIHIVARVAFGASGKVHS